VTTFDLKPVGRRRPSVRSAGIVRPVSFMSVTRFHTLQPATRWHAHGLA
jgi:hypothetical protein